ncbi:hypothetical protein [Paenibacillus sp. FSL M7-0896]|uniref:hypothetical protein n=1 Tax=Paenibacillus sp. FSL M7-0896 TaxID=2921610 RepID=UPI0030D877EF
MLDKRVIFQRFNIIGIYVFCLSECRIQYPGLIQAKTETFKLGLNQFVQMGWNRIINAKGISLDFLLLETIGGCMVISSLQKKIVK